jgi:hypothetical protein
MSSAVARHPVDPLATVTKVVSCERAFIERGCTKDAAEGRQHPVLARDEMPGRTSEGS